MISDLLETEVVAQVAPVVDHAKVCAQLAERIAILADDIWQAKQAMVPHINMLAPDAPEVELFNQLSVAHTRIWFAMNAYDAAKASE